MPEAAAPRFTFIGGGDDFIVGEAGQSFFEEKAQRVNSDFGKEIVNGQAQNVAEVAKAINQCRQAIQTQALFGECKVVWFKSINFLGSSVVSRAEGTRTSVERLQESLSGIDPKYVTVILTASPIDRRNCFVKWCTKQGDFRLRGDEKQKGNTLAALIKKECTALQVTLTEAARQTLIVKLNSNPRQVREEIHKLAAFLGKPGSIKEEHVLQLVPDFGESDFFEAAEALDSGNLSWCLEAIRRHCFAHKDIRGLLTALQRRNRLMLQLRMLIDSGDIRPGWGGVSKATLTKVQEKYGQDFVALDQKSPFNLFTQNPWYLNRLAEKAARFPIKQLLDRQQDLLQVFEALLERPTEQEEILSNFALRHINP